MASLLIPDFYPLRADAGSTEPVILGQTDLSIPYPWIRWLELLYRFRGYIDVTSFLLRRTTKIGCPTCLDWSKASCCVPNT